MVRVTREITGLLFITLSISISTVCAFVYQERSQYFAQKIIDAYLFFDYFDEHTPPEAPDGWNVKSGTWQTATDGTVVYEQTDTTIRMSRSVAGKKRWTNYTFEVKVKFVINGTGLRRGAILFFRYQNASNYYFLRMLEDKDKVQLYRRIGGNNTRIASINFMLVQDQWYNVKINIEGQTINVWIDGTQVFTNQESGGPLTNGKIGLGTRYYHCCFDDVKVYVTM